MLEQVVRRIPPPIVRALGRLQHRGPLIGRIIRSANTYLTQREGVIAHGIGEGLRFNATGGFPGYLLGTSEPEEQQLLASSLSSGDVFYDVGCNIGFFTTLAARCVGPTGRVYGFEPTPEVAKTAAHNARINGFDHVQITEVAVSDEDGHLWLTRAELSPLNSISGNRVSGGVRVEGVTVDTWREREGATAPTVVTIDVEGAELHVLRGMLATIRESQPIILVEVHWLGDAFHNFFESELQPLGYQMRALDGQIPTGSVRWHAILKPT